MLHPTIKATINSNYRSRIAYNYLGSILKSEKIDPRAFWEFRERYSPGNFLFNSDYIDFFQTFKITNLNQNGNSDLLYYISPLIGSTESLTNDQKIMTNQDFFSDQIILFKNETLVLSYIPSTKNPRSAQVNLLFILPIEEMKRTNGFFDYTEDEISLLKNSSWLSHSQIEVELELIKKLQAQ